MKFLNVILIFLLFQLSSCGGGEEEAVCESAAECEREDTDRPRTQSLNVDFVDSVFMDLNTNEIVTIEQTRIDSGEIGLVPVYSNLINKPLDEVKQGILQASRDAELGLLDEDFNKIPFFRIRIKNSENYQFQYTRRLGENIVAGTSGNVTLTDGEYAYIPLINDVFNGQLSSLLVDGATSGDYTHKVSVTATSPNAKDSEIKTFEFRVLLNFPTKTFIASATEEMENFNVRDRWQYYYGASEGTANDDLPVIQIEDAQEQPDSQSADLRIVFREPPVMRATQVLFDEEVIDLGTLKSTGAIIPFRGNSFIQKTINLNSAQHFRLKMSVNGSYVDLSGGNEFIVRNIPPDEKWKIVFRADFNKNDSYPGSRSLLKPLKPMCNIVHTPTFFPLSEAQSKIDASALGGFYSVCHPETARGEEVLVEDMANPPVSLKDTWFDFFSYKRSQMNYDSGSLLVHDVGHFYGIREVRFSMSGCMRVYSREASALATNPNAWELKSEEHDECGTQNGEGWVFYNMQTSSSISEFRNEHSGNLDLQILMDALINRNPVGRSDFRFNGDSASDLERFY
jgi:hypothetical protein